MNRSTAWKAAQVAIVVAALWFVIDRIRSQWGELTAVGASLRPDYPLLLASAAVVMSSYVVLIWT